MSKAKFKSAYYLLIIGPKSWDRKPILRKSWGENGLMNSDWSA